MSNYTSASIDKPGLAEDQKADAPSCVPRPVGQEDSLTDQPRKAVSEDEQMAPAPYDTNAPSTGKDED